MESFGTFFLQAAWDVFKNVLGSRADAAIFGTKPALKTAALKSQPRAVRATEVKPMFRSFDAANDLAHVLPLVDQPVLHLLIEAEASTFYNLAAFVLESRSTGQWYIFSRGRIALQGSGGGKNNLDGVVAQMQERSTPLAAWVIQPEALDQLEHGTMHWNKVRVDLIPLVAASAEGDSWPEIRNRFRELARDAA